MVETGKSDANVQYIKACTPSASDKRHACPAFDRTLAAYAAFHSHLSSSRLLLVRDEWASVGLGQQWMKRRLILWLGMALSRAVFVQHCKPAGSDWRMPICGEPHFVFDRYFVIHHNLSLEWRGDSGSPRTLLDHNLSKATFFTNHSHLFLHQRTRSIFPLLAFPSGTGRLLSECSGSSGL